VSAWLGVVSADHVRRGVSLGIAQLGHGKRSGLARLHRGDWLIYYSPKTSMRDGEPLQQFTAIGEVVDDEIWQADEGDFQPFRRRIHYLGDTHPAPVASLHLDLTSQPNWGYQLRRGLIPLSERDLATIREAMTT
jgi:hypothetical protein